MPPQAALPPVQAEGVALYVHWPWCKHKCPYCDFNSHVDADRPEPAYVDALCTEISHYNNILDGVNKRPLTSIFFGGGTPSLMSPASVAKVLEAANKLTGGIGPETEITLEANPTSSEAAKFKAFAAAGVNRFSIGVQGLDQQKLEQLGRTHDVPEALAAVAAAQQAVNVVNLDLIFGLPGQSQAEWATQLQEIARLGTAHISCYQLTIEKNTAFYAQWRRGQLHLPDVDTQADFYSTTTDILAAAGYQQYEVSNYAKPGHACRHNRHIWRYGHYLGVGAGAHGRVPINGQLTATRAYKMPATYLAQVAAQGHGRFEEVLIAPQEQGLEALLLGLRLTEGLPLARLAAVTGQPWQSSIDAAALDDLVDYGLLTRHQDVISPTPRGLAVLDSVIETLWRPCA